MESPPKRSLDDLRIDRTRAPERHGLWVVPAVALLLLAVVALGVWWFKRPGPVQVQTAAARQISNGTSERVVLNASGYVTARREATVSSKVTGKVVEVFVEEGIKVQAGQILARLDDTNLQASLLLAEAQLLAATNALAETAVRIREAQREFERQTGLSKNGIATAADLDRAESGLLALRARLEQQRAEVLVAQRQVATWQRQMEDTVIRAPFAGIVTSKNAQPGEMISPISAGGGFTRTGICTIVDMESLEIEIDVNESYINRVSPSQPVEATLDAYPEWKIPCKVIAIIPTADRQKSTVRVRVGFEKLDARILPQMSVKVAFREGRGTATPAQSAAGVAVPNAAVRQLEGKDVVFVVRNGKAEARAVTVARREAEAAIVAAGVSADERVVVQGPAALADGMDVTESGK